MYQDFTWRQFTEQGTQGIEPILEWQQDHGEYTAGKFAIRTRNFFFREKHRENVVVGGRIEEFVLDNRTGCYCLDYLTSGNGPVRARHFHLLANSYLLTRI